MKKLLAVMAFAGVLSVPSVLLADANWYGSLRGAVEFGGGEDGRFKDLGSRWGIKGSSEISDGLSAVYRFEHKISTANAGQPGGRLAYAGLSGGFGTVSLGQVWSASFNHVGVITDPSYAYGGSNTSYRIGNAVSYAVSAGAVSLQVDAVMDGGKNTGEAVDQMEFGMSVDLGDVAKLGLAFVDKQNEHTMTEPYVVVPDAVITGKAPEYTINAPIYTVDNEWLKHLALTGGEAEYKDVDLKPGTISIENGAGKVSKWTYQRDGIDTAAQDYEEDVTPTFRTVQYYPKEASNITGVIGPGQAGDDKDREKKTVEVLTVIAPDGTEVSSINTAALNGVDYKSSGTTYTHTARCEADSSSCETLYVWGYQYQHEAKKAESQQNVDAQFEGTDDDGKPETQVRFEKMVLVVGNPQVEATAKVSGTEDFNAGVDLVKLPNGLEVKAGDKITLEADEGTGSIDLVEGTGYKIEGTGKYTGEHAKHAMGGYVMTYEKMTKDGQDTWVKMYKAKPKATHVMGDDGKPREAKADETATHYEVVGADGKPAYTTDTYRRTYMSAPEKMVEYGSRDAHIAAKFNLGAVDGWVGYSQLDSKKPDSHKKKVTHYGVSGGIGDTGMGFVVAGKSVDHGGDDSNPWFVQLTQSLGDSTTLIFEHGNADDDESGTTVAGVQVNF